MKVLNYALKKVYNIKIAGKSHAYTGRADHRATVLSSKQVSWTPKSDFTNTTKCDLILGNCDIKSVWFYSLSFRLNR